MPDSIPAITAAKLKAMLDAGDDIELIDVREPDEYRTYHLPGSKLIPLNSLPYRTDELDPDKTQIVICHIGGRSAMATAFLCERNYEAINLAGGVLAWVKEVDPSMPT